METGERRLEVTRGKDGCIVLTSMSGGMPVGIRMTEAGTRAVIAALTAEVEAKAAA